MRYSWQVVFTLIVVLAASLAHVDGIRDAASKVRGDYDRVTRQRAYYYTAPRMASPAPAQVATAPAPAERRSFSAQPGQTAPETAAAPQPARTMRTYSYQPSQSYAPSRRHLYDSQADTIRDAGSKIRADF